MKVAVPVGVITNPETVVVKVTGWPNALGLADEITVVVEPNKANASVAVKDSNATTSAITR
jgi:hypothetical protein